VKKLITKKKRKKEKRKKEASVVSWAPQPTQGVAANPPLRVATRPP
jgi:hypothetical protein